MRRITVLIFALAMTLTGAPSASAQSASRQRPERPITADSVRSALAQQAAKAPAAPELRRAAANADTEDAGTSAVCYTNTHTDASYDIDYLDVTQFGASYSCDSKIWAVGMSTRDYWYADELDYIEFYFDTDDNMYTGCYGDDYSVFGYYDYDYGLLAGVFQTPSCDDYGLIANAGISRSSGYGISMAFYESSIGSPESMWYWGALENVYSYDLEDIGDGYSYLLSDFHPYAAPSDPTALTVDGTFARSKIGLGASTVFNGMLEPAYDGAAVHLQKYSAGAWKTVSTKTLYDRASFSFSVSPGSTAVHKYRVRAPGNEGHLADVGPTRTLTVYNARITSIRYNPPGPDSENLNGEYAVVKNTGSTAINLNGWKLDAGSGKVRTLPTYILGAGSTVKLHTGRGSQSSGHIYLRFGAPIWRDTYDTGRLIDGNGRLMSRYSY